METIYFDHASTTPVYPRVREAMLPFLGAEFGNPSSHYYGLGQRAAAALEGARAEVAALVGARPEEIVFTSGGTEANNLALEGILAEAPPGKNHVVTSNIEHWSVLNALRPPSGRGFEVTYLPVDAGGLLAPRRLEAAIAERTALVAIMHANTPTSVNTSPPLSDFATLVASAFIAASDLMTSIFIPVPSLDQPLSSSMA